MNNYFLTLAIILLIDGLKMLVEFFRVKPLEKKPVDYSDISVALSAFNEEKMIEKTIQSFINNGFSESKIFVCDDVILIHISLPRLGRKRINIFILKKTENSVGNTFCNGVCMFGKDIVIEIERTKLLQSLDWNGRDRTWYEGEREALFQKLLHVLRNTEGVQKSPGG